MESQIKASFIPQDVGHEPKLRRRSSGGGSDLLILAAIILLVASIALGAATFLYTQFLTNTIAGKQASIDRARAAIEPALIDELSRLDSRMRASDILLQQHIAPSVVFDLLEQVTLQSIALTDFSMTTEGVSSLKISMKGVAQSVNSIALQSDLYGKSGIITSPIFSDINRTSNGLMSFRVDAILNPNAMHYSNLVNKSTPSASPQTILQSSSQPQTQAQTQTPAASQASATTTTTTTTSHTQSAGTGPAFTPVK